MNRKNKLFVNPAMLRNMIKSYSGRLRLVEGLYLEPLQPFLFFVETGKPAIIDKLPQMSLQPK